MLEYTKCDAVMIGRGVLGNPFLVSQTVDYLETGTYREMISIEERKNVIFFKNSSTSQREDKLSKL